MNSWLLIKQFVDIKVKRGGIVKKEQLFCSPSRSERYQLFFSKDWRQRTSYFLPLTSYLLPLTSYFRVFPLPPVCPFQFFCCLGVIFYCACYRIIYQWPFELHRHICENTTGSGDMTFFDIC